MLNVSNIVIVSVLLPTLAGLAILLVPSIRTAQRIAAALTLLAAGAGLPAAILHLLSGKHIVWELDWVFPGGPLYLALDPLAAFFLLPILLIAACSCLYGVRYRPYLQVRDRFFGLFLGVLPSSMAFVVLAKHAVLFLLAWEAMALSCFFLLTADHEQEAVREAGILYLVATHTGTLVLVAFFVLLYRETGSFVLPAAGSLAVAAPAATALFLTAVVGFGAKAGLMPLHVWLPSAHANAPSHVSALMSGVILKMGIYGIVRMLSWFATVPIWWGGLLLTVGVVSAVAGVAFALGQHDIKRLLAYHSIENIGIITMGLGVGLVGLATGNQSVAVLGVAGGLLHVLNHAIFKALLFLGAGAVIHVSGTREIDRTGGLLRLLPRSGLFFLVGSVAICGLPPLNGFISELLVYLGLFRQVVAGSGMTVALAALAIPALAVVGGLAVACFVKVFGVVFLGVPRQPLPEHPAVENLPMTAPMGILAAICLLIGVISPLMAPLLETVVASWHPALGLFDFSVTTLAPLGWVSWLNGLLIGLIVVLALWYARLLAHSPCGSSETWGCGYLAPSARMQYTASSFAAPLVALLTPLLRPRGDHPVVSGTFPAKGHFHSHVPEVVLDLLLLPLLGLLERQTAFLRRFQHGQLHLYILYIFATLFALMVWIL